MTSSPHIVIVGSGMGGASLATALAPSGRSILILERGERLVDCARARDDNAIFRDGYYRPEETWINGQGDPFNPGNYYYVGGNSKFYGAVLLRYRKQDFGQLAHIGGHSPAWPISYETLEPWYQAAEELFSVCGDATQDPTEPFHSGAYPFPPVSDEPEIADLRQRLRRTGVTPSCLPLGIDIEKWLARGKTPWDAFPDTTGAKKDAESVSIERALSFPNVSLETDAKVTGFSSNSSGRITRIEYQKNNEAHHLSPELVVLSAGAVNSAVLLLKSANEDFPRGLANSSDLVGRNFMNHNTSAILAINPLRINDAIYQKTLQINDYYLRGGPGDLPMGNLQLLGKISANILAAQSPLPLWAASWVATHAIGWYAMSEDLPNPDSRVKYQNGKILLDWKRSNWNAHAELIAKAKSMLRRAGYPIVVSRPFDRRTPSHQCGTTKFGENPDTSVLDIYCRAHDHKNLFVVDAGFLPTSAAVNPALTIAAQALRVGAHIMQKDLAA